MRVERLLGPLNGFRDARRTRKEQNQKRRPPEPGRAPRPVTDLSSGPPALEMGHPTYMPVPLEEIEKACMLRRSPSCSRFLKFRYSSISCSNCWASGSPRTEISDSFFAPSELKEVPSLRPRPRVSHQRSWMGRSPLGVPTTTISFRGGDWSEIRCHCRWIVLRFSHRCPARPDASCLSG
jgi:hypothetical protein